jgi:hypothetical protein
MVSQCLFIASMGWVHGPNCTNAARMVCYHQRGHPLVGGNNSPSVSVVGSARGVSAIPHAREEGNSVTDFLELASATLGDSLDLETRNSIADVETQFRARQSELITSLTAKEMSPDAYLAALNKCLELAMRQMYEALGSHRFRVVFGEAGHYPDGLIDPDAFSAAMAEHAF